MSDVRTLSNASTVDNIRSVFGNAVSRYVDVNFPFDFKFSSKALSLLKNMGCAKFSLFLQRETQRIVLQLQSSPFLALQNVSHFFFFLVYQRGKLQSCSFNALKGNHLFVTFILKQQALLLFSTSS